MTERTHGFDEDICGKAYEAMVIAEKAFRLGCEVAVVQFMVGADSEDPWGLAFAVADSIAVRMGRGSTARAFAVGHRQQDGNVRGHYEIRRGRP